MCTDFALRRLPISPGIDGIPDEWKSAPGLAAMLGSKGKENDTALAHPDLSESDLVLNFVFSPQPA